MLPVTGSQKASCTTAPMSFASINEKKACSWLLSFALHDITPNRVPTRQMKLLTGCIADGLGSFCGVRQGRGAWVVTGGLGFDRASGFDIDSKDHIAGSSQTKL